VESKLNVESNFGDAISGEFDRVCASEGRRCDAGAMGLRRVDRADANVNADAIAGLYMMLTCRLVDSAESILL
jgi:hypothetical protein